MKYIKYSNRPPHCFLDDTYYFVLARTVNAIHFFNTDRKKVLLIKCINTALRKFKYTCQSYVILNNHYQLVIKTKTGEELPEFVSKIHRDSARKLNKLDPLMEFSKTRPLGSSWSPINRFKGRKIWWNYWDKCLETEKDFWTHVNYNHHNPVKHGYARRMGDYKFSSYNQHIRKFSKDFVFENFSRYSIIDYSIDDEFYGESAELAG